MDTIGGYRLIRKLGSGSRADVFLGHVEGDDGAKSRTAAIKLFRPAVSQRSIDFEIEALARSDSAHIVHLFDLASDPDGVPCLILQRLGVGGLAGLLSDRGMLEAGEAVTILAPVVAALGELHQSGFVHGNLDAASILFDDSGAPVVAGFGSARLIGGSEGLDAHPRITQARLDSDQGVAVDIARLCVLARAVLARTRAFESMVGAQELDEWLEQASHARPSGGSLADLEERLFDLADASPVRLDKSLVETTRIDAVPNRVGDSRAVELRTAQPWTAQAFSVPAPGETQDEALAKGLPAWLIAVHLPPWVVQAISRSKLLRPICEAGDRLRSVLKPVRKPVWIAAAAGGSALVLALALIPASDDGGPDAEEPTVSSSPVEQELPDAITADDPVVAAEALLALRERCFRDRSILCLDGVDQADSAAWDADQASIRAVQDGGELTPTGELDTNSLRLLDRMGDSALVALLWSTDEPSGAKSGPASVLMIRTEAGWRIRSLLLDPTGSAH